MPAEKNKMEKYCSAVLIPRMRFEFSRVLGPVKFHYFFFFAGLACVMPIIPDYIHQLGISYTVIGDMFGVLPFSVIFGKLVFSALADRFKKHKLIFVTSIALTAATYFLIDFIPDRLHAVDFNVKRIFCSGDSEVFTEMCAGSEPQTCVSAELESYNIVCSFSCRNVSVLLEKSCLPGSAENECVPNSNSSISRDVKPYAMLANEVLNINASQKCVDLSITNSTGVLNKTDLICNADVSWQCATSCTCGKNEDRYRYDTTFLLLFALLIISYIFAGVAISVGDALAMDCIIATKGDFGVQRVFGTMGWGLFAIISGALFESFSYPGGLTNYSPGFILLLILLTFNCFIAYFVKVYDSPKPKQMLTHVLKIYSDPRLIVFSLAVFVMGFLTSALWTFLVLYLKGMGAPPTLIGYVMGVQCFGGELPLFLLSGLILKKVGHIYSMSICLMVYALRYLLYSLITDPWWVLPIELTNGFTFGLFFATMVTFASIVAPEGMSATTQGALQSIYEGLGVGIGNLVCGRIYQNYGGREMYRILGVASCICCVVYTIVMYLILKFGGSHFKDSTRRPEYANKATEVTSDEKLDMKMNAEDGI